MNKIKKIITSLSLVWVGIMSKIYGITFDNTNQADLYGPPQISLVVSGIGKFISIALLPIAFIGTLLVGIIVFIFSKKNKKK